MMNTVTLMISAQALAVIGQALRDLPYRVSAPVIAEIDQQLVEQAKAKTQSEVGLKSEGVNT